jgi:lipoprotein-anchoring transpeptidase ErfK/SrfK
MTQDVFRNRKPSLRAANALAFVLALILTPVLLSIGTRAQTLDYVSVSQTLYASDGVLSPRTDSALTDVENDGSASLPERLRRATVSFDTRETSGTIVIDTGSTELYYVLGQGRAICYGVGVGREGFTWFGVETITHKAEWPDWYPPAEMISRQPYLPRFVAGGPGNPLGARAMYLGNSKYRIHGTNDPSTIGKFVSSGCIRLTNEDVTDLFSRVDVGTKVVVLPKNSLHLEANSTGARETLTVRPTATAQLRPL